MQPRVLKTCRIPEADYSQIVLEEIEQSIHPEEVMILGLVPKFKNLEDRDSPIFVFQNDKLVEALKIITSWVEMIDRKHFLLPSLKVTFFVCITSKALFDSWMKDSNCAPEGDLRIVLNKIYEQQSLE